MASIIPLSEGSFTVDASKDFIPFNPDTDELQQRNRGSLLVEIQPFLLISENEYLLLDTGLGFHTSDGLLQLHQNLINNGIAPNQVTKVLMSHLHKDHAGGVATKDEQTGERRLSFPQATYYVNKNELDYALEHQSSSYRMEDMKLLKNSDNVVLTEDNGNIGGLIDYEITGGHSPYHQVFRIRDKEGIYFFGGDEAPQLSQLKRRFMAKYDHNGRKSMELRQQYLEEGTREGWTFLFYHDIQTPFWQAPNP